MNTTNPPLGYLIRQLDHLLTQGINDIQSQFSLTRSSWQMLHSIHEHEGISEADLAGIMKPFANEENVHRTVQTFADDEIVALNNGAITLSTKGRQLHKTCFEKQQVFRQKAIQNVSEEEYMQAVAMLQKMIDNLR